MVTNILAPTKALLRWYDYQYFPYEKKLARLEIERITQSSPRDSGEGLQVTLVHRGFNA